MQIPLRTSLDTEAYIRNREWRVARLPGCPLHPAGGCSFARHGSYARVTPRGLRIARWYCPEGHRTFSLLPDFLAARMTGLLTSIEDSITGASTAKSFEAAASALRGPDITLPGAVRWLRRRVREFDPCSTQWPVWGWRCRPIVTGDPCCLSFAGRCRRRPLAIFRRHSVSGHREAIANRVWGLTADLPLTTEWWPTGSILHAKAQRSTSHPASPAAEDMLRIWHADRCLQDSSAVVYLLWIKRFRAYCALQKLDERAELTLDGASRFIAWYAQHRRLDARRLGGARTALYALSRVYQVMERARQCGALRSPRAPLRLSCCGSMPATLRVTAAIHRRLCPRSWTTSGSSWSTLPGRARPGARWR